MLASRLRDRVTIMRRTSEPSPFGVKETWHPVTTVWGQMAPMRVDSRAAYSQALNTDVTHNLTIRHAPDVTPQNHRIRWRGRDYQVIEPSMDKDTTGAYSHIVVKLIDDGG